MPFEAKFFILAFNVTGLSFNELKTFLTESKAFVLIAVYVATTVFFISPILDIIPLLTPDHQSLAVSRAPLTFASIPSTFSAAFCFTPDHQSRAVSNAP